MSGYAFHPDAFADLDEIWEYIAHENVDAADRVPTPPALLSRSDEPGSLRTKDDSSSAIKPSTETDQAQGAV
jgi:hypothetical protein